MSLSSTTQHTKGSSTNDGSNPENIVRPYTRTHEGDENWPLEVLTSSTVVKLHYA